MDGWNLHLGLFSDLDGTRASYIYNASTPNICVIDHRVPGYPVMIRLSNDHWCASNAVLVEFVISARGLAFSGALDVGSLVPFQLNLKLSGGNLLMIH